MNKPNTQNSIRDELFPNCPIRNVLTRISGKWALLVLFTLNKSNGTPVRFKQLERDGLVSRKAYAEIPPRVEYCLTPLAQTLLPIITELIDWAKNNMPGIMETRMQHIIK